MKFLCIVLISIFCISANCTKLVFARDLLRMCSKVRDVFGPFDPAIKQTMIDLKMFPKLSYTKQYDIDRAPSFKHACAAINRLSKTTKMRR
ncbi:hypothetical protein SNEBB_008756 [Seison nebaliae]|nr:hypothetical protein SNEBB_008756 [Seison nebaliae]